MFDVLVTEKDFHGYIFEAHVLLSLKMNFPSMTTVEITDIDLRGKRRKIRDMFLKNLTFILTHFTIIFPNLTILFTYFPILQPHLTFLLTNLTFLLTNITFIQPYFSIIFTYITILQFYLVSSNQHPLTIICQHVVHCDNILV